ncbi:MAG: transposase [Candidatus Cloacimonadales bacterium]
MSKIKGWYKSNFLPHCDCAEVYQFITFRLYDSVPADVIQKWKDELRIIDNTEADSKEAIELQMKILKYEDNGYGECFLKDKKIAQVVADALFYFDGERYDLYEWCIMPNHVHVLIKPRKNNSLPDIIHSWKSFTANKANKILQRTGKFWMRDYFDRYIRNDNHYQAVVNYIRNNAPLKSSHLGN